MNIWLITNYNNELIDSEEIDFGIEKYETESKDEDNDENFHKANGVEDKNMNIQRYWWRGNFKEIIRNFLEHYSAVLNFF